MQKMQEKNNSFGEEIRLVTMYHIENNLQKILSYKKVSGQIFNMQQKDFSICMAIKHKEKNMIM